MLGVPSKVPRDYLTVSKCAIVIYRIFVSECCASRNTMEEQERRLREASGYGGTGVRTYDYLIVLFAKLFL